MQSILYKNDFILPPVDEREALRYAGAKMGDAATHALFCEAATQLSPALSPAVVAAETVIERQGDTLLLEGIPVSSLLLSRYASEWDTAYIFCATVGIGADRCIRRFSSVSPALSHMISAVATERIEALCDYFSLSLGEGAVRVSPGYADIPLSLNRDILRLLDCRRRLGVTLTESLLMTPTKSVTAILFLKNSRKDGLI